MPMEAFTCNVKHNPTLEEAEDFSVLNYYGEQSFMVGSEGLQRKTWDQINSEDFARNKTLPWLVIEDFFIDEPYETKANEQVCSAMRRIAVYLPDQDAKIDSQMELKTGQVYEIATGFSIWESD